MEEMQYRIVKKQKKIGQFIHQSKHTLRHLVHIISEARALCCGRSSGKKRVCLLGSGNWGSAVAKILGTNAAKYDTFETEASC